MKMNNKSNALYSNACDMVKTMVSQEKNTFHSVKTSKGMTLYEMSDGKESFASIWLPSNPRTWKPIANLPFPGGDGRMYRDYSTPHKPLERNKRIKEVTGRTVVLLQDWGMFIDYSNPKKPCRGEEVGYTKTRTAVNAIMRSLRGGDDDASEIFLTNYWLNLRDGECNEQGDPFKWHRCKPYSRLCSEFLMKTLRRQMADNLVIIGREVYTAVRKGYSIPAGSSTKADCRTLLLALKKTGDLPLSRIVVIKRRAYKSALSEIDLSEYIDVSVKSKRNEHE